MAVIDKTYHQLLNKIMTDGYTYEDPNRKGVKRLEIPSYTFRHEFKDGFPAISTKKLHYKNVVTELLWFLRGDTNIKYLVDNNCNIWNKDAYNYYLKNLTEYEKVKGHYSFEEFIQIIKETSLNDLKYDFSTLSYIFGDLGPVYGKQWRNFSGVDQIQRLITNLKEKPLATDHIVNSWNVGDLENMALPPCHYGFQIVVKPLTIWERSEIHDNLGYKNENKGKFHGIYLDDRNIPRYGFELHWSQRSVDTFLGLPYNIASYATLALILEKITGYKALAIQGDLKKVHLYDNSLDAVKEQLSRDVDRYDKCELLFKDEFHYITDKKLCGEVSLDKIISQMKSNWFILENYKSYPAINVEMLERDE